MRARVKSTQKSTRVWSELGPGKGKGNGEWKPEWNIAVCCAVIIHLQVGAIVVAVGSPQIPGARDTPEDAINTVQLILISRQHPFVECLALMQR
jgi:hypothetical protein